MVGRFGIHCQDLVNCWKDAKDKNGGILYQHVHQGFHVKQMRCLEGGKGLIYISRRPRSSCFFIESSQSCIPLGDIHVISKEVLEPFNPHPLSLVCNLASLQICISENVFG